MTEALACDSCGPSRPSGAPTTSSLIIGESTLGAALAALRAPAIFSLLKVR
jgi:hypothetical protein